MLQLVSRHVIENSGDRFHGTELRRVVGLHQKSSWQCYYMLGTTTKLSMPFQVLKEIFFLGLGLTVTEINMKKYTNKT